MTTQQLDKALTDDIVQEATFAFWDVVAKRLPLAHTGDLSIGMTIEFDLIAKSAVVEWVNNSVDIPVGYRFALRRDVDRFPNFVAKQGMTGTVTVAHEDGLITAKMDNHIPGAEEWRNELWWDHGSAAFLDDTVPLDCDS